MTTATGRRADAVRNVDALLVAAQTLFAERGVDAPVRDIAARAGVGVGTVYRHFPQRSDLVVAVFRREVDECADSAPALVAEHAPAEALRLWLQRFADFMAAKRGLAAALHSGDPAFEKLPAYFDARLRATLIELLEAAAAAGEIAPVDPDELLTAVVNVCSPADAFETGSARRMVDLLVAGLRNGAPGGSGGGQPTRRTSTPR